MSSTFLAHCQPLRQARETRDQAYHRAIMKQRIENHVEQFCTMIEHLSPAERKRMDDELVHMEIEQRYERYRQMTADYQNAFRKRAGR